MPEIGERLARIETGQEAIRSELAKVVTLLDRMVRVEEKLENALATNRRLTNTLTDVESRLKDAETELSRWGVARKIFVWVSGVVGAVMTGLALKHWG